MARAVCSFCFAALLLASPAAAEKVYTWQDERGAVHYSNRALDVSARVADLPGIMRAEMKPPKHALESCTDHGGVNCKAGADVDGSVICRDGFTSAAARFLFTCGSPKLRVAAISELRADDTYAVTIRNWTSIAAVKPSVSFLRENGKGVKLEGPEKIDGRSSAEFILKRQQTGALKGKLTAAQVKIGCGNCPQN